jgi:hemerythrin-like domain-containing protein
MRQDRQVAELFPSLTADFDHPIEVLDHCHERILRNCRLIERIAARVQSHGPDPECREAAHQAVRFFDTAGEAHHRDEDEDFFPALLQMVPAEELDATRVLVGELRADHARLDSAWREMRHWLRLLAAGGDTGPDPELARTLTALYERHIAVEEARLLPLARRVLDPEAAERVGMRMARRRGVKRPAR